MNAIGRLRAERPDAATVLLFLTLTALAAFFLLRPVLGGESYYRPRAPGTTHDYWHLVALAFIPYIAALRARQRGSHLSWKLLFAGAVAIYALFVAAPPQQSQDVYQYLVYGDMAIEGANPYVDAPSPTNPWTRFSLWDGTPSVYGPLWTSTALLAAALSDGDLVAALLFMKGITAALTLGTAAALAVSCRRRDGPFESDPGTAVIMFAYNPLVVVSVGLGAHADAAVAAAFATALLAARRGRDWLATVLLVAAALVKVYAAILLVVWLLDLQRRKGWRVSGKAAAASAFLGAIAFAPWWQGWSTLRGIAVVGRQASASITGGLMRLFTGRWNTMAGHTTVGSFIRWLAIALFLWVCILTLRNVTEPWRAGAILLGAYLLLTPWFLYWHLLGLLALVAANRDPLVRQPTLVFSGTSLAVLPGGIQTIVRYGPPLIVLLRERRLARDRVQDDQA